VLFISSDAVQSVVMLSHSMLIALGDHVLTHVNPADIVLITYPCYSC